MDDVDQPYYDYAFLLRMVEAQLATHRAGLLAFSGGEMVVPLSAEEMRALHDGFALPYVVIERVAHWLAVGPELFRVRSYDNPRAQKRYERERERMCTPEDVARRLDGLIAGARLVGNDEQELEYRLAQKHKQRRNQDPDALAGSKQIVYPPPGYPQISHEGHSL